MVAKEIIVGKENVSKICRCKVSIVIATYNTGRFIRECLDSIFEQTLKEIEVIIIDDGSTDNTKDIIEHYKKKYSNLVYYYQKNQGAGKARNYGIEMAGGEYLAFMDPDDKYPCKDSLEKLYITAKESNVLICGGTILSNDNGIVQNYYCSGDGDIYRTRNQKIRSEDFFYLYGHTRYLFELDFIKRENICFANYKVYEDQVFTIKALCMAGEFYELDYPVYEYRINYKEVNIDYSFMLDMMKGFRDTLRWICDYNLRIMFEKNYASFIEAYISPISKYVFQGHDEFDMVIHDINELVKHKKWFEESYLIEKIDGYKKYIYTVKNQLSETLIRNDSIIIYGAGTNTRLLISLYKNMLKNVIGIAVSDSKQNASEIEGFIVRNIEDYISYRNEAMVLITPEEKFRKEIIDKLCGLQFKNYIWIDINSIAYELVD